MRHGDARGGVVERGVGLRRLLVVLPLLTLAVVGFALLGLGRARPYLVLRVHGGAVPAPGALSLRLVVTQRQYDVERPAPGPLRVTLMRGEQPVRWEGEADETGRALLQLPQGPSGQGPLELRVQRGEEVLAAGELKLPREQWLRAARRGGGWLTGTTQGSFTWQVAPRRGTLAVGIEEELLVVLGRGVEPGAGALVTAQGEGFAVPSGSVSADAGGRLRLRVTPLEPNAALRLTARSPEGVEGQWYTMPRVVSGGMELRELAPDRLAVWSPFPREEAYVAILDEQQVWDFAVVELHADARGGASAELPRPRLEQPTWGVVSLEPELDAASTIGWPLDGQGSGAARHHPEPARSLVIPEQLLLDGAPAAFQADAQRRRLARWVAGGFTLGAALLALALTALELRRSEAALAQHLAARLPERSAQRQVRGRAQAALHALLALALILLGFALVGLLTLL